MTMKTISIESAQQDLPDLVKRALDGEEIVILSDGRRIRLAPLPAGSGFNEATARRRGYGALRGKIKLGPEFFEPLSDEECGRTKSAGFPTSKG